MVTQPVVPGAPQLLLPALVQIYSVPSDKTTSEFE
jgi:hypothetical protein